MTTCPDDAGSVLYTDILLPIVGFVFLWGYVASARRERVDSPDEATVDALNA